MAPTVPFSLLSRASVPGVLGIHSTNGISDAFYAFRDQHTVLFVLTIIAYAFPTFFGLCYVLSLAATPQKIPYLPALFLSDGMLVCCCPLAAILPVLLWPLVLALVLLTRLAKELHRALQWFAAAPTFCGIRRGTIRQYVLFVLSVAGNLVRVMRDLCGAGNGPCLRRRRRQQHTTAVPPARAAAHASVNYSTQSTRGQDQVSHVQTWLGSGSGHGHGTMHGTYGTINSPPLAADRDHRGYQPSPAMGHDTASIVSVPPPYSA